VSVFEGRPRGEGRRIAIVAARFNEVITRKLVEGAIAGLTSLGVAPEAIDVAWVPGAFEIPLVAGRLARSGRFAGFFSSADITTAATPAGMPGATLASGSGGSSTCLAMTSMGGPENGRRPASIS
jgi:6,7-dimethyl-8-ribityllumazine synthase